MDGWLHACCKAPNWLSRQLHPPARPSMRERSGCHDPQSARALLAARLSRCASRCCRPCCCAGRSARSPQRHPVMHAGGDGGPLAPSLHAHGRTPWEAQHPSPQPERQSPDDEMTYASPSRPVLPDIAPGCAAAAACTAWTERMRMPARTPPPVRLPWRCQAGDRGECEARRMHAGACGQGGRLSRGDSSLHWYSMGDAEHGHGAACSKGLPWEGGGRGVNVRTTVREKRCAKKGDEQFSQWSMHHGGTQRQRACAGLVPPLPVVPSRHNRPVFVTALPGPLSPST